MRFIRMRKFYQINGLHKRTPHAWNSFECYCPNFIGIFQCSQPCGCVWLWQLERKQCTTSMEFCTNTCSSFMYFVRNRVAVQWHTTAVLLHIASHALHNNERFVFAFFANLSKLSIFLTIGNFAATCNNISTYKYLCF